MQKVPLVSTLCVWCVVFVFNGLLSGAVVMCLMLLGVGGVAKTNNNGIDEWMGVVWMNGLWTPHTNSATSGVFGLTTSAIAIPCVSPMLLCWVL